MPILRKYRKDSILYFEGDPKKEIFLIRSGRVVIAYKSISGDAELNETLGKGEFFGTRAAIANIPREETVTCIEDAQVLVFNVKEFEALVRQTPDIGVKILRGLSYNLRQIGREEKKQVTQNSYEDPGNEVFKMGMYFFNQRSYQKAIEVWKRFLVFFPDHPDIMEAQDMIEKTEEALKTGYHPTISKKGS